jgi:hypothetical protein
VIIPVLDTYPSSLMLGRLICSDCSQRSKHYSVVSNIRAVLVIAPEVAATVTTTATAASTSATRALLLRAVADLLKARRGHGCGTARDKCAGALRDGAMVEHEVASGRKAVAVAAESHLTDADVVREQGARGVEDEILLFEFLGVESRFFPGALDEALAGGRKRVRARSVIFDGRASLVERHGDQLRTS